MYPNRQHRINCYLVSVMMVVLNGPNLVSLSISGPIRGGCLATVLLMTIIVAITIAMLAILTIVLAIAGFVIVRSIISCLLLL